MGIRRVPKPIQQGVLQQYAERIVQHGTHAYSRFSPSGIVPPANKKIRPTLIYELRFHAAAKTSSVTATLHHCRRSPHTKQKATNMTYALTYTATCSRSTPGRPSFHRSAYRGTCKTIEVPHTQPTYKTDQWCRNRPPPGSVQFPYRKLQNEKPCCGVGI